MGIDLKVLVSHFREHRGEILATAAIRLERDKTLFARLVPEAFPCLVRGLPAGLKVGHHEDEGLRWDEADRSGNPLTFTTPAALSSLRVEGDIGTWNRAALAFLLALPPDTRIVLFWC